MQCCRAQLKRNRRSIACAAEEVTKNSPSPMAEGSEGTPENVGSNSAPIAAVADVDPSSSLSTPTVVIPPDLSDINRFLSSPLPKQCGVVKCYIRRNKNSTNMLFPIYSLYLNEGDVFLLASRKRPNNCCTFQIRSSSYIISSDVKDLSVNGGNYIGKLRSNFIGTEFQISDSGVNSNDSEPGELARGDRDVRNEMGVVTYAANFLVSMGPRKMQVALPGLDESGKIIKWKEGGGASMSAAAARTSSSNNDMLSRLKDRNFENLIYLISKPPRWNEQVQAYVLNFKGRVTIASVKNFQLVDPKEEEAVVLQFGRVGTDEFTMDLQWPISPYQAFAITLSSLDSKIACK